MFIDCPAHEFLHEALQHLNVYIETLCIDTLERQTVHKVVSKSSLLKRFLRLHSPSPLDRLPLYRQTSGSGYTQGMPLWNNVLNVLCKGKFKDSISAL